MNREEASFSRIWPYC